jgi:threonylcarbamoyladenosine tRNA methylthiotransferase MtaB
VWSSATVSCRKLEKLKFSILTFGCRCNQAESDAIRESLCGRSMVEIENRMDADLAVVNTCTVTQRSDQQVRQAIRRLHRENPSARIIVTGCYAERDPAALADMPGVSLVVGNGVKERLAEIFENAEEHGSGKIVMSLLDADRDYLLPPTGNAGGKTRPLVKLQDGCDAHCAYCIVPHVRGPGRSARLEDVLAEIQSLADRGFQEIVLTGVHLGAFGLKLKEHPRLIGLLRRIAEIPRLGRIRLSSIEPMHFDRAIVDLTAENPVFAHHFHIPLQSGSDRVLSLMRRPYTAARFRELLAYIQDKLPDAGIGADVLIGFPGETDGDFAETCALIQESPLTYLHVFPFSPREGTAAFSMPGRISSQVMRHRLNAILEISRAKNIAFRRRFTGQVLPGITISREENLGTSLVLTGNYIHAQVPGLSVPPNRLVNIRIDEVLPDATYASIL